MIKLTNKEYNDLLVKIEEGTKFTVKYLKEYEQQKQRADELEKRWDTLRRKLKYEYDTANNRTELRCFGMSLDIMHDLEEDDND